MFVINSVTTKFQKLFKDIELHHNEYKVPFKNRISRIVVHIVSDS